MARRIIALAAVRVVNMDADSVDQVDPLLAFFHARMVALIGEHRFCHLNPPVVFGFERLGNPLDVWFQNCSSFGGDSTPQVAKRLGEHGEAPGGERRIGQNRQPLFIR